MREFSDYLYILILADFLKPSDLSKDEGSDVTTKAVLLLFKRVLTDMSFVFVVIEEPSAVQTMTEFLRRYGKQLYHT